MGDFQTTGGGEIHIQYRLRWHPSPHFRSTHIRVQLGVHLDSSVIEKPFAITGHPGLSPARNPRVRQKLASEQIQLEWRFWHPFGP